MPEASALQLARPVVCIVGPTASGKTELSQALALAHDGEIVSADSMQVYRGMDIGTGKLPARERKVAHFGIDICEPGQAYSAALFQAYARSCFADIDGRGRQAFLCGGTGFYVRAAIDAYDFPHGTQEGNPVREYYTRYAEENGAMSLWVLLDERDHASAELIHPHNVRRVVRAFEMLEEGTSYAVQKEKLHALPQAVPALLIGLEVDPEVLARRIDARVDAMVDAGLIEEVEGLLEKGLRSSITAPQAIGYKEIVHALDGEVSMDEAIEQVKTNTRRYAKRQRSWFRSDPRINWLRADSGDTAEAALAASQLVDRMKP